MKTRDDILEIARRTLHSEINGLTGLDSRLGNDFYSVIKLILECKARVIITGVGKSALIAQKIVATFNSTGTPSVFMHAADAVHGDLGIVQSEDVVICISKSGNTPEIKVLVPLLKHAGNTLIGLVGDTESYLAQQAGYVLDTTVQHEACPLNLAPTTSTTAQLVMGDMLAVCLLECRSFSSSDFAMYHPGGALGKKLYLKVSDIYTGNEKPQISREATVKEVLLEITRNRLGAVAVVENDKVAGIITDGDIRRMMEKYDSISNLTAADIMSANPRSISGDELAVNALELMRGAHITQLLVVDNGTYKGVIHIHDIIREGII